MPICNRCGKSLCTDQALKYHLTKKRPCNKIHKCFYCKTEFNTEMEYLYHKARCNMSFSKIKDILNCSKKSDLFILDSKFNIQFSCCDKEVNADFLKRYKKNSRLMLQNDIRLGGYNKLYKLADKKSFKYISCLPHHDRYLVFEGENSHSLAKPGYFTPQ